MQILPKLTVNLRICKDFTRITSGSVDPGGLIDSQLRKDLQRLREDYLWQCWSWEWVDWQSTKEGSTKTLQGLPLTVLILGGGGQSKVNLGRVHKDFARITSGSVDPGGVNGQLTVNLGRIHEDLERITSDSVDPGEGSIDSQLRKDLQRLYNNCLWQCWSWGGQPTVNLGRICKDLSRITSDSVDPWVGWLTVNLGRICKDFTTITSGSVDPGGQSIVNLGRIHKDLERIHKKCWSWGEGSMYTLSIAMRSLCPHTSRAHHGLATSCL